MGAPIPVGDVIVLVTEPQIWNVGAGKIASTKSGGVEPPYISALIMVNNSDSGPLMGTIYHEIGHYYDLYGPSWLSEGAAQFLEAYVIAQDGRVGLEQRLMTLESSRRCDRENIQQHIDDRGWAHCDYELGEKFILATHEAVGPETVSAALRELYERSQFFEYLDEDTIYYAFLSNVPRDKEEAFKTVYRRYHGGPIVDQSSEDNPDRIRWSRCITQPTVGTG